MDKNTYLLESFKNIQELIRFTDQKIAGILVVCSILISVFLSKSSDLIITTNAVEPINLIIFLIGATFLAILSIIMYLSTFKVLKPRYASNYTAGTYSTFYFEHIALNDKSVLYKAIDELGEDNIENELKDQIFEISKILYRKNKATSQIMWLIFIDTLCLFIYLFFASIL